MMVVLRVQVNSTAPSMQIAAAGLVFALVQILRLARANYLVFALVKNRYLLALVGLLHQKTHKDLSSPRRDGKNGKH